MRPRGFEGYSEAEHHVGQGLVVVAIDHLGVGDSSLPEDEALMAPLDLEGGPRFDTRTCAGRLIEPSIVAREAGAVRTPVFMAYGENDVTLEPLADAGMFRCTADLTLLIVPRMAHMHNFAPSRRLLWRRLDEFALRVARNMEGEDCDGQ